MHYFASGHHAASLPTAKVLLHNFHTLKPPGTVKQAKNTVKQPGSQDAACAVRELWPAPRKIFLKLTALAAGALRTGGAI